MAEAIDDSAVARAQAVVDDDTAAIDAWFDARDGWQAAVCETGEQYVTYGIGGPKAEGEVMPMATTAAETVERWRRLTADLRRNHPAKTRLYWRRRPEIRFFPPDKRFDETGGWAIRARLCVTTEPELPATDPWRQSIEESIRAAKNA